MRGLALLLGLLFASHASAYFQQDLMKNQKVSVADHAQWTLADWLDEKKKISLMDQWLALHRSAHIFSADVGAAQMQYRLHQSAVTNSVTNQSGQDYRVDLNLSILNLYGEAERLNENVQTNAGAVGLRLLGGHGRTTGLLARYGWQQWITSTEKTTTPFVEGVVLLYFVPQVGIEGTYRDYFEAKSNLGNSLQGYRWTGGVFFELGFVRLFANYFGEPMRQTTASASSTVTREGLEGGLALYF